MPSSPSGRVTRHGVPSTKWITSPYTLLRIGTSPDHCRFRWPRYHLPPLLSRTDSDDHTVAPTQQSTMNTFGPDFAIVHPIRRYSSYFDYQCGVEQPALSSSQDTDASTPCPTFGGRDRLYNPTTSATISVLPHTPSQVASCPHRPPLTPSSPQEAPIRVARWFARCRARTTPSAPLFNTRTLSASIHVLDDAGPCPYVVSHRMPGLALGTDRGVPLNHVFDLGWSGHSRYLSPRAGRGCPYSALCHIRRILPWLDARYGLGCLCV